MVIDSSGNVGIGTTGPGAKLEVAGGDFIAGTTGNNQYIQWDESAETFYINSSIYPPALHRSLVITGYDTGDQLAGYGVGILFKVPATGGTLVGASIDALRANAIDADSSTELAFSISQNDETLDEAMRIDRNGNVGIGTTGPSGKLNVAGTGTIEAKIYSTDNGQAGLVLAQNTGVNSWTIYKPSGSSDLRFYYGGTGDTVTIDSNGNVGIGTTSPDKKLHIHESSSGVNYINITNDTTGQAGTDGFLVGINSTEGAVFWNYENTFMQFATNNNERMRIEAGGNVGIGTTAPSKTLEISAAQPYTLLRRTDITRHAPFAIANSGDYSSTNILWQIGKFANSENLDIWNWNGTLDTRAMTITTTGNVGIGTTGPARPLHVDGANVQLRLTDGSAERIELGWDDSTNVGHMTISAGGQDPKFDIRYGSAATSQQFVFTTDDGTTQTEAVSISRDGNVGIGTTSPGYRLTVEKAGYGIIQTDGTHTGGFYLANSSFGADLEGLWLGTVSNHTLGFFVNNGNPSMVLHKTGNVGIGTASPEEKLEVKGKIRVDNGGGYKFLIDVDQNNTWLGHNIYYSGGWKQEKAGAGIGMIDIGTSYPLRVQYAADQGSNDASVSLTTAVVVNNSGNVGIGTVSPTSKLGVLGNLAVGGTYGALAAPTGGLIIEGTSASGRRVQIANLRSQEQVTLPLI
jgi:hypothetical protein